MPSILFFLMVMVVMVMMVMPRALGRLHVAMGVVAVLALALKLKRCVPDAVRS